MDPFLDQKQSVQARFGPAAANYASAGVHKSGPDLEAMLPAAAPTGVERVLDVGCGAGHTAIAFAPVVKSVDAVDLTPAMLAETERLAERAGVKNLTTKEGDVEALPYADGSFEIVTCRLCAHHFGQPGRALSEIARVLAPGGQLLLVDIVSPEDPEQDSFLNALEMLRDPSHVRDHSVSQWLAMLGAAGIAPQLVETWPMRLDFEAWLRRIGTSAQAEVGLRALFGAASRNVRAHFEIGENLDFTITNALLRATRAV